MLGFDRKCKFQ